MKRTKSNKNKKQEEPKVGSFEFYLKQNRFSNLLKSTQKLEDLFFSKEALLTCLISVLFTYLFYIIVHDTNLTNEKEFENLLSLVKTILTFAGAGLFSLLGFTIGGLAIVTGTISKEVIDNIRENSKLDSLMSVIFNFYFCGVVVGFSIFLCSIVYLILYIQSTFSMLVFLIITFVTTYFVVFCVIYTVMLLGTCIRIFLLKYFYQLDDTKN